jgi:hypothetical protein
VKRLFEKYYPSIIALFSSIIFLLQEFNKVKINRFEFLLDSTITVCITIIGFFITIIAILISLMDKKIMKIISKYRAEALLTDYFISPILSGFVLIIYCFYLGYAIDQESTLNKYQVTVFIYLITVFAIGTYRVAYMLVYILRLIPRENSDQIIDNHNIEEVAIDKVVFNRNVSED